jgi:hypothetical protein
MRGYTYRKQKRELADIMLETMCKDLSYENDPSFGPSKYVTYGYTLGRFHTECPEYSYEQYDSGLNLLRLNKHVSLTPFDEQDQEYPDNAIFPTTLGKEAYMEGFYDKEDRKDQLEERELLYRKWLPLVTFGISLMALTISIITFFFKK